MISLTRIRRARRPRSAPAPVVPSPTSPEPAVETDAEFLARIADEEAAEKARVLATYRPLPEDVAEFEAWSHELDAGTLPPDFGRFRFGCMAELDAIRSGQISEDELAQFAAHGAI
jgi:hypothetical protein